MASTFSSLPLEIRQMVFEELDNDADHKECMSVCKDWKYFNQEALYTSITLSKSLQVAKLLDTLKNNQILSDLVKEIEFQFENVFREYSLNSTLLQLYAYTPNLEYVGCSGVSHYKVLLDALIMNQLPRLDYVTPPIDNKGSGEYSACSIILRDRLEILKITERSEDNFSDGWDPSVFHRLFSILDQYKNLKVLHIEKQRDNIIDLIEKVTQTCPLLQVLDVNVISIDQITASENDMSNYTSLPKIASLTIHSSALQNPKLIYYIIHKFPCLRKFKTVGKEKHNSH